MVTGALKNLEIRELPDQIWEIREKIRGREMGCTCTEEWWFQEQQKHPSSIHSYIHELTSIAKGKATHHSV